MRYLSIYKTTERSGPPSQEEMAEMGKLIAEGMKAGWLIGTEGCLPTALGARVRSSGAKSPSSMDPSPKPRRSWAALPSSAPTPKRKPSNSARTSSRSPVTANASCVSYTKPRPAKRRPLPVGLGRHQRFGRSCVATPKML